MSSKLNTLKFLAFVLVCSFWLLFDFFKDPGKGYTGTTASVLYQFDSVETDSFHDITQYCSEN